MDTIEQEKEYQDEIEQVKEPVIKSDKLDLTKEIKRQKLEVTMDIVVELQEKLKEQNRELEKMRKFWKLSK